MPKGIKRPEWLSVRPQFDADVRVCNLSRRDPLIALSLDSYTRRILSWNCKQLIASGFDLTGLYVGRHVPDNDPRIEPHLDLLGQVTAVTNGRLALTDLHYEDIKEADPAGVYLELRHREFDRLLAHAYKAHAPSVAATLEQQLATFRSGPERLSLLRRVVSHLGFLNLEFLPNLRFTIEPFLSERDSRFPPVRTAPGAVYVFDSGFQTDTWHDRGLNEFGPYNWRTHTPSAPRICVICQKTKKGQVEQFINKFLNGIRNVGAKREPYLKGFIRKYYIEDASVEFFLADDESAEAYKRAIREALSEHDETGPRWDLAMVQIEDSFHALHGKENPYLVSKCSFLSHQIPVQEFTIETVNTPNNRLSYVMNNMALATYAKLSGTPWLIKCDQGMHIEFVIGLGSATIGERRLGQSERVVGITTVFTGDGNYCLSNRFEGSSD